MSRGTVKAVVKAAPSREVGRGLKQATAIPPPVWNCTQARGWMRIETYYEEPISNASQLHPTERLDED